MPDVDIEILDALPDTSEHAYPKAKELQVESIRVRKGDLIFSPADEHVDSTWEVIYGFDWGGIYTDFMGEFQMPRFRKWSDFVSDVEDGDLQVVMLREETSFFVNEEMVRSLSHYRNHHEDGVEFIIVERTRHPLETTSEVQSFSIYESAGEMVDDIYTPDALETTKEAEEVYQLLIDSGVQEGLLTPPDEISNQAGLDAFTG